MNLWAQDYEKSENYGKKIAVFGGSFSEIIASNVTKAYWAEKLRQGAPGAKILFFSSDNLHLNTAGYNHIKETQARFISAN